MSTLPAPKPGGVLYPWHCIAADTDHREEAPDA